ncbi:MAG TPA: LysR family transcriptional regulator [Azospirillaceae bacterium]|nr:LysR family transcriptional regulator [Azospirillaceae bacterium]
MDKLQAMLVFTRVVEANSFARAADMLGMPRATVTTTVQNLEASLGVRLLNRTTRRLSLTFDGAAFYERAVRILADVEEAESAFGNRSSPKGRLHVDMPSTVGRLIIIPLLHEFRARYPDIDLKLGLGDRPVDLVQEGIDCVLRIGELQDSSLIARRVGLLPHVTCASPAYLARKGVPTRPEEVADHDCVQYFSSRTGRIFHKEFLVDGEVREVQTSCSLSVNDGDGYVAAALEGFGLIQPLRFMVVPHLRDGRLVEVLPEYAPPPRPMHVVYPHSRHLSPKVRVFVDWVAELFERCPLLASVGGPPNFDGCPDIAAAKAAAGKGLGENLSMAELVASCGEVKAVAAEAAPTAA